MQKKVVLLFVNILLLSSLVGVLPNEIVEATGINIEFNPTDDAYVNLLNPNSNYGSLDYLYIACATMGGLITHGYIKFDISVINTQANIISATLKLHRGQLSGNVMIYVGDASNNWNETSITWNNKPSYSIGSGKLVTADSWWHSWDVTSNVRNAISGGVISLCVSSETSTPLLYSYFDSKESDLNYAPILEINYSESNISPIADFLWSANNLKVNFIDQSTDLDGIITNWEWYFGEGIGNSSEQNPTCIYSTSGTYPVTLTVIDDDGATANITHLITVNNSLSYDIFVDDDYDSSTPGWQIDHFDKIQDGIDAASVGNTVYVYSGTYNDLLMYGGHFYVAVIDKRINLIGENKYSTIIDSQHMGFAGLNVVANGVNITGFKTRHSNSNPFSSGIRLSMVNLVDISDNILSDNMIGVYLTNAQGNTIYNNLIKSNIRCGIYLSPFSYGNLIYNNYFENSVNAEVYIDPSVWDSRSIWFIQKTPGINIIGGPYQGGNYWSNYCGSDNDEDGIGDTEIPYILGGVWDELPLVFLNIPPTANFTYEPLNPTDLQEVTFTDTSTDSDGIILSWLWDFGDGNISTNQNPTHQYGDDGAYTVILNVTDDDGAANETTQQIIVANVAPVANDDCYSVAENDTLYISAPGVLENDSDADGDSLSASLISNVSNGVLTLFDNGSFGYTPTVGYNGADSFTYKAFDGIDYSNEATVTIWVISNHPPYIPSNPSPSDGKTNVDKNKILSWSGGDPDPGDTVTYDVYFGTSNPPSKTSSNQSGTNYDPGTMSYNTKHYWKIIAWDNHNASAEGPIWSFTTEKESTQPPYNPPYNPPPTNQDPIANASASETLGFINTPVMFDGSLSSDEDGSITNYTWNFGDETTGYGNVTTHAYVNPGEYIVTLTVTDSEGATDDDTITVVISKPNIPPTAPEVDGASSGTQNTEYAYSAVSTDADNDTIQYFFDWGDGETTTTDFLPNGTATTQTHTWTTSGEYTISVKAYDNETESGTTEYTVLMDVWPIDDEIKGYLVDEDGDGTFDLFDSSETGEKITIEKRDDGTYLIDIDGDGSWDHTFSMAGGLSAYQEKENNKTPGFKFITLMCAIAVFLSLKRKRKV